MLLATWWVISFWELVLKIVLGAVIQTHICISCLALWEKDSASLPGTWDFIWLLSLLLIPMHNFFYPDEILCHLSFLHCCYCQLETSLKHLVFQQWKFSFFKSSSSAISLKLFSYIPKPRAAALTSEDTSLFLLLSGAGVTFHHAVWLFVSIFCLSQGRKPFDSSLVSWRDTWLCLFAACMLYLSDMLIWGKSTVGQTLQGLTQIGGQPVM